MNPFAHLYRVKLDGLDWALPLTAEERPLHDIHLQLDEAFRQDSSIRAMNRAYRRFRTGDAETDQAIRDHIGMLYLLDRAKPALLEFLRRGGVRSLFDRLERKDGEARRT